MNPTSLLQLLPGPFNFLRPEPEELRRLLPDIERAVPLPHPVFLDDEAATPMRGFPILLSPEREALARALQGYVRAEEMLQLAILRRDTHDRKNYNTAWERYRKLLSRSVENAT